MQLVKRFNFLVLLSILFGVAVPYEIVRAILLAPLGKRVSPVKSWGRITNFRVRVIRQSLSWAVWLKTWNAFDFHLAMLLHKRADRIKLDRWAKFEHNGLLEGSDIKCVIQEKHMRGTFDALWFRPAPKDQASNKDKIFLYFHGGGFTVQFYDDPMYYPLTKQFARYSKRNLLSIDYRASLEEPFPYCLQDAVSAYRYLTVEKGYDPANITLGGDSAGANLALSTIQYIIQRGSKANGLELPGRLFLVSPWTDMTVSASQDLKGDLQKKAQTDYIPATMGLAGAVQQTGTKFNEYERRTHPYLSPLFGDFSALKAAGTKIHVTYGSVELLHDEQEEFIEKLKEQVGEDSLDVFVAEDMVHDHQLVFPDLKISKLTHEHQGKWFEGKTV